MRMSVRIDLLVTPDCPNAEATEALLRSTIARLVPGAEVAHIAVRSAADEQTAAVVTWIAGRARPWAVGVRLPHL